MEQGPEPASAQSWLETIEARIDPAHTLPEVGFAGSNVSPDNQSESRQIMYDDQQVGVLTLEFDHTARDVWIRSILIVVTRQRQGLGLSTYKRIIKESLEKGYSFRTSPDTQTEEAKRIWEQLAAVGVAQIISEFIPKEQIVSYDRKYYKGQYVVPAHSEE